MAITTAAVGSYPKTSAGPGPEPLERAIEAFAKGLIGGAALRRVEDELVAEVVAEQAAAGAGLVTDGQVRWTDPQSAFARRMTGFRPDHDDPAPYLGGAVTYRRPHVTGPVGWGGPVTVDDWRFAASVSPVPVKQVLTGPYSMVKLSRNAWYGTERELVLDVARVLNQESFELEAAGCAYIQFDEPAIVRHPDGADTPRDFGLLAQAADILTNGLAVTTEIRTYFGAVQEPPEDFFALPFRVFGLDLVDGPSNWDLVKHVPGGRTLAAGIVDGRTAQPDAEDTLVADMRRLLEFVAPDRLHVTPSCGLASLPRAAARAKLEALASAAQRAS